MGQKALTETRHHIHDARWQAGLVENLRELQHCGRGQLRRLHHHRVTRGQRNGNLLDGDEQGVVPRRDEGADSEGNPPDDAEVIFVGERWHVAFHRRSE